MLYCLSTPYSTLVVAVVVMRRAYCESHGALYEESGGERPEGGIVGVNRIHEGQLRGAVELCERLVRLLPEQTRRKSHEGASRLLAFFEREVRLAWCIGLVGSGV